MRVIDGRRRCERSWQEHFDSIIKSEEARGRSAGRVQGEGCLGAGRFLIIIIIVIIIVIIIRIFIIIFVSLKLQL